MHLPFRLGLRAKLILWAFVPATLLLLTAALISFLAYQKAVERLLLERDEELTRLAAGQLGASVTEYADLLDTEARAANMASFEPAIQRSALASAAKRLVLFDAGLILLDSRGHVIAAAPSSTSIVGQDWSDRAYVRQFLRAPGLTVSDTVADGPDGASVIAVAVPVFGAQGELSGALVGMFKLGQTSVSTFYGDIVRLRIEKHGNAMLVDGHGRVLYHSDPSQIGQNVGASAVVQRVLNLDNGAQRVGSVRLKEGYGESTVAGFAPVPGTPWALMTETSWSALAGDVGYFTQFLGLLVLLGVVAPVLFVAFLRRITQPINELIEATQAVAGGKFNHTIVARTGDEIETLANQFNHMSAQLRCSYANLEQRVAERTRELAALNDIANVVNRSLDLDYTLEQTLAQTLQVLHLDSGGIYLLEPASGRLKLAVQHGFAAEYLPEIGELALGEGLNGRVAQTGAPLVIRDVDADERISGLTARAAGLHSLASVPLFAKEKLVGTLFIATYGYREFGARDIELLSAIGAQAAIAIENAQLYSQAQQLAALEERSRLARELHDSVTQSLYSLTLLAEGWRRQASSGMLPDVVEPMTELGRLGQQALKEMRLLIYELRPPDLEKEGLLGALHQRLEAVERRAGIHARLLAQELLDLPLPLEDGLYRIAQEALTNTLKHAGASEVTVRLQAVNGNIDQPAVHAPTHRFLPVLQETSSPDVAGKETAAMFATISHIELEVADNGCGFDPALLNGHGGLGLRSMSERAQNLQGAFQLESTPGAGTTVRVRLPVAQIETSAHIL
ncbi:MAG: GAF domain-containing protein [Caldilineaceae bacterium]